MVEDWVLTIFKDQLSPAERGYDELTILDVIHRPNRVPGVVEAVHSEITETLSAERYKHLLGLRESGLPFTSIPTLQKMLEISFDVLEGI